ncbi:MAG: hypothetical protein ACLQM8_17170 [Limisphaerales bacterium]
MITYRVFIAAEVITALRACPRREQQIITRLFEELGKDPYRAGDYSERDAIGRPVQVLITGSRAICFWADHAVKEVKIVDLRPAGR